MKPSARVRSFLALTGTALLAISYSHAGNLLYWDGLTPAGAPGGGGPATWNLALGNWDLTQTADSSTAWVNANLDIAVFGGAAGTVTLGSNIDVGGLRFDTTNYNITTTGSYTLNFAATDNTILFNNAATAATITGTVGGTGNVILSNATGTTTAGTLTFNGTSATGWSGTTTINAGMTLATVSTSTLINKVLSSTTGGITLNGGTIQFTRASNSDIDAINNSAIGVNGGGTFSVTSSGGGASASETIGTVTVNSGQMNFVQTANNQNSLVLGGLSRGVSTTSAVNFSSAALGTAKIVVTGAGGATTAGQIFAPWATAGITANTQTDYAVFNASNEVGAAGITALAQSSWSTTHALNSNYTLTNVSGAGASAVNGKLTLTRKVNTVRNTTASTTAAATNGGVASLDYFSIAAGHVFVDGDVVSASGTGGLLNGGDTYYVINSGVGGADRFQLSTTPGGSAVDLTNTTNGVITGGITLSTGNNLETYGILNGSSAALAIGASGTGALTTPTGGGSLYLTTGAGGIFINAPITNSSDSAAVTVVKNGTGGRLNLSGNNSFTGGLVVNGGGAGSAVQLFGTQSFTGGITLNGGGIGENSSNSTPITQAATLGSNAITVNGPSHLVVEGTLGTSNTITINPNAVLKLGAPNSSLTVQGVVSGSGVLDVNPNNYNGGNTVSLTNSANTFSGDVIYAASNGNTTLSVSSIGDAGKVMVGLYANSVTKTFALNSTATANLTFNNRQFELVGPSGGHNLNIANDSARSFDINTDLLASGVGTRTLTLQGAGAGLSTFTGDIGYGSLTSLGITKAGAASTWVLSGANTYNGKTTVSAGTLSVNSIENDESTTANALGTPGVGTNSIIDIANTGILQYTGTGHGSDRVINMTGNGGTYTVDASGSGTGLTLSGGVTAGGSSGTSTLALTGYGLGSQSGVISNGTGTNVAAVSKSGIGTWTLGGNNSYTGSTTLNAGKLKLDYSTNDTSKLSNTASIGTLLLNGGTLELSGGTHVETVLSTTLNTGGTFVTHPTGGATLSMGAITFTGGAIDFAEGSIATTTTGVTNGILSQRATVAGANFAMKSGSDIVAYDYVGVNAVTGYTGALMSANINYLLTSNAANTLAGTTGATSNTLKIANTAAGSLAVGSNTLTVGTILFTGSADYDITTSGSGRVTPSILHNYGTSGAVLNLGALGGTLTQFGTGKTVLTTAAQANAGVTVNGGTVQFSTNAQLGTPSSGQGITLNNGTLLSSETLTLDNGGLNKRGITLNAGGGTLAAASTKTLTVSGVISGTGNPLTVGSTSSNGTVELTGTNTYTGRTTVTGGKLLVNGSISTSVFTTVQTGATLGGTGTVGHLTIDSGGFFSPGNSPGIETVNGNYIQNGTLQVEIEGLAAGNGAGFHDQVVVNGTVTLNGLLSLTTFSGTYAANDLIFILLNDGVDAVSGSFTGLAQGAVVGNYLGFDWQISYTGNSAGSTFTGGNDVVLMAIPEPRAALLGGLGMLLLLRRRRSR